MNSNISILISAVLLANMTAPASARIDGDEGGASAYPRFRYERNLAKDFRDTSDILINRPFYQR